MVTLAQVTHAQADIRHPQILHLAVQLPFLLLFPTDSTDSTACHLSFTSTASWLGFLDLVHSEAVHAFKSGFTCSVVFRPDLFPNWARSTAVQTAVPAELKAPDYTGALKAKHWQTGFLFITL